MQKIFLSVRYFPCLAKDQLNKIVLVKPAADLSDIRAVMLVGN